MQYYNSGRRRLISDIFSPLDRYGFKIRHPYVKDKPIGLLDRQYRRKYQTEKTQAKSSVAVPEERHYSVVPPLAVLHDDSAPKLTSPISKIAGFSSLAWLGLRRSLAGVQLKRLVPVLLILLGLTVIWLRPKSAVHHNPPAIQIIPVSRTASLPNSGNHKDSANNGNSANGGGVQASPAAGYANGSSGLSGSSPSYSTSTSGTTSGAGGLGGGPSGGGTTTGTGSAGSPGLLPATLTIPPINTGVDGKTLLDTSGTTLTVN